MKESELTSSAMFMKRQVILSSSNGGRERSRNPLRLSHIPCASTVLVSTLLNCSECKEGATSLSRMNAVSNPVLRSPSEIFSCLRWARCTAGRLISSVSESGPMSQPIVRLQFVTDGQHAKRRMGVHPPATIISIFVTAVPVPKKICPEARKIGF